jgi:hypothetical protein
MWSDLKNKFIQNILNEIKSNDNLEIIDKNIIIPVLDKINNHIYKYLIMFIVINIIIMVLIMTNIYITIKYITIK